MTRGRMVQSRTQSSDAQLEILSRLSLTAATDQLRCWIPKRPDLTGSTSNEASLPLSDAESLLSAITAQNWKSGGGHSLQKGLRHCPNASDGGGRYVFRVGTTLFRIIDNPVGAVGFITKPEVSLQDEEKRKHNKVTSGSARLTTTLIVGIFMTNRLGERANRAWRSAIYPASNTHNNQIDDAWGKQGEAARRARSKLSPP